MRPSRKARQCPRCKIVAVNELAITVIGHDRPGIIADVAEILAGLGMNLTDSTMTRLRGHFAMTLICQGDPDAERVETALDALTADGALLAMVRLVNQEDESPVSGRHYVLTVHGTDRLGIVAAATRALAEFGGNVTDLTTRLAGALYLLVAEVDLPIGVDAAAVRERLLAVARPLGVEVGLRQADADLL
jgi:glycine cleavage system transcriptional repressor